jgi:hypothetical protein
MDCFAEPVIGRAARDPLARNDGGYRCRLSDPSAAALRRQSRHRQSPPSIGIGRRTTSSAHQHGPARLQVNCVPHREQARRREGAISNRFVINRTKPSPRFSCRVQGRWRKRVGPSRRGCECARINATGAVSGADHIACCGLSAIARRLYSTPSAIWPIGNSTKKCGPGQTRRLTGTAWGA